MGRLENALAAMEQADAQLRDEALAEGDGIVAAALRTGFGALEVTCEAWGLDLDQLIATAYVRGLKMLDLTLAMNGATADPAEREFVAQLIAGGLITGVRVGLLVADEANREFAS